MSNYEVKTVNSLLAQNPAEYIRQCEKVYSDQLDIICDEITREKGRVLVMLAGPSSSGKTTTARMIKDKLSQRGRGAVVISLDDFYLELDNPHTFEDGTVDFETVEALDIPFISECLHELMDKGESMMPRFCFKQKKRSLRERVSVCADEVIIVEGLHALNPVITDPLSDEQMKKYYVSVSSRITDGDDVLMTKRDMRFIRRLIRDFYYRNSEVEYTFYLWHGVRMGEDRYLFPYSGLADRKIDSIHPYETALFKSTAIKLLDRVAKDSIYYETANELKIKLDRFTALEREMMPDGSLLGEFIG